MYFVPTNIMYLNARVAALTYHKFRYFIMCCQHLLTIPWRMLEQHRW